MTADEAAVLLGLDAGVIVTEAPAGMRGAKGLGLVVGRRTGAKASAADHPIPVSEVDGRRRKAVREMFQLTSSRVLW